jgi:hypothetical protein
VLAAAEIAGVDEIWRIGGAQAIAALAYGTDRSSPVDVIVGPGNAWVAEAKRQLYRRGRHRHGRRPVRDRRRRRWRQRSRSGSPPICSARPSMIPTSQSILFTDDAAFADAVAAVDPARRARHRCDRARRVGRQWRDHRRPDADGGDAAWSIASRPSISNWPSPIPSAVRRVRHAGSVFLGRHTPEAVGDYVAGPNHVLPTGRRARFASGLSVLDFMKRTSFIACDAASLAAIGPAAVALAHAEGCRRMPHRWRFDLAVTRFAPASSLRRSVPPNRRSPAAARLAAVQALYQQEMENTPLVRLLDEFHQHRLGATIEDVEYAEAEVAFFDDVVRGVDARREEIDATIVRASAKAGTSPGSIARCARSCAPAPTS